MVAGSQWLLGFSLFQAPRWWWKVVQGFVVKLSTENLSIDDGDGNENVTIKKKDFAS